MPLHKNNKIKVPVQQLNVIKSRRALDGMILIMISPVRRLIVVIIKQGINVVLKYERGGIWQFFHAK